MYTVCWGVTKATVSIDVGIAVARGSIGVAKWDQVEQTARCQPTLSPKRILLLTAFAASLALPLDEGEISLHQSARDQHSGARDSPRDIAVAAVEPDGVDVGVDVEGRERALPERIPLLEIGHGVMAAAAEDAILDELHSPIVNTVSETSFQPERGSGGRGDAPNVFAKDNSRYCPEFYFVWQQGEQGRPVTRRT